MQVKERLPWFLKALPSEDCAKGGAGAYNGALQLSSKESSGIKVQVAHAPQHLHQECRKFGWCLTKQRFRIIFYGTSGTLITYPCLHVLQGLSNGVVEASSFRTSYVPLNKQEDFINGMQARPPLPAALLPYNTSRLFPQSSLHASDENLIICPVQAVRDFLAKVKQDLGLEVYSFSIFHVFFEQYLTIGHDALVLLTFATLAVTAVVYAFTASLWASALICIVLIMILVRSMTS